MTDFRTPVRTNRLITGIDIWSTDVNGYSNYVSSD